MVWVLSGDAPVADVNEYAVLGAMADKADPDGCGSWLAKETIAARVHISEETVKRCWRNMLRRGLIAKGDQNLVRHYRADRRPVVYDLMIPYDWFSNIDRLNAERSRLGREPLTREERPTVAPAPVKPGRADKGKPRPKAKTVPDPRGNSETPRDETPEEAHGGTTSRPRGNYKSSTGDLVVPQYSPCTQSNTRETQAPAARAVGDARRAGAGSSARDELGGSAASDGAGAPKGSGPGKRSSARGSRLSAEQASAVATVEAAWPQELATLLPRYRPAVIRDAILAALDGGRTAEQLAERVRRRWWEHGYAADAAEGGKGIGSAVGVAVGLVRPPTDCPDPMCEDGARIHVGRRDVCPKCEERRAQRRADRRKGLVPGPRGVAGPAPIWWDCAGEGCTATGKGTRPGDGLCWACHNRVEAEEIERATAGLRAERDAEYSAQAERAKAAAKWALLLDDAYAEHVERETAADAVLRARRAAEVEETRRIREQLARDHPELAVYAQQPEEQDAAAPF